MRFQNVFDPLWLALDRWTALIVRVPWSLSLDGFATSVSLRARKSMKRSQRHLVVSWRGYGSVTKRYEPSVCNASLWERGVDDVALFLKF